MKITTRLPLIFAISSAVVLVAISIFIYWYSADYRQEEFSIRLNDRVTITEQLFLEAENLPEDVYEDIREKFLHTLPDETENVYEVVPGIRESLIQRYPEDFIDELISTKEAIFTTNTRQGMGKSYIYDGKQYFVIVTASDIYGVRTLKHLKTGLIIAGLISIILLALTALLEARQFLRPISEKIEWARTIGAENLHLRLNVMNEQNELGQLALAFNQMLDRLEDAFEMQKTFISNASHEIRNPLTAISGEVEVALEKKRTTEEYEQTLAVIQKEAERLGELVNNLLGLAKTGMDPSLIRKESLRMDELVFDLVKELSFRNPDHQLKINYDQVPEDSGLLEFMGNAHLLRMALGNILDNACKFSDNKEVNLTLAVLQNGFQLIIQDKGVGISAQDIKRINQPFYRGNNARHIQGFGIGLALTQKILDIHQGKIEIESEVGKGSIVKVFLPKSQF